MSATDVLAAFDLAMKAELGELQAQISKAGAPRPNLALRWRRENPDPTFDDYCLVRWSASSGVRYSVAFWMGDAWRRSKDTIPGEILGWVPLADLLALVCEP